MANTKISDLTAASTLTGTEEFPCSDGTATTKAATAAQIKDFVENAPVFAAGSTTAGSWPKFTSGTVQTTPDVGSIELDSNCFYGTTDAGNRGIIPVVHLIRQDAAYTLTSQTTAQQVFNAATNGRITLETGVYRFEALIALTAMSATSGNATFDIAGGTATLGTIIWYGFGRDVAADGATGTLSGSYSTDTTLVTAPLITAGTATAAVYKLEGTFEVTAAGTFQLRILLQTAAAASVTAGSFMLLNRIGSTTATTVGQWD